jgi:histidine phosphotransferase ChpT
MNEHFPLRLAELITSRLCHDLITPIGAINTGLELFHDTPNSHLIESDEILNLILQSAQAASARVSYFRIAFGSSCSTISLDETHQLIKNYFLRSKLEVHWKIPLQKDLLFDGWGRLLLNAVLWMGECAPRGGTIHVCLPTKTSQTLSLLLKADSIICHQGTLEALEGQVGLEDLTPRTIPCYLIHYLMKEKKKHLKVTQSSSPLELFLEIKPSPMKKN